MSQIADLVVYSRDRQITLIVEVKARTATSRSWAMQTRRNMLAHGTIPNSQFFLLALPDKFYLWKDAGNIPELREPTYEIDAVPFFQPYYEKSGLTPDSISGQSFEMIVTAWLNELIDFGVLPDLPEAQRTALEQSGLLEALRGGNVIVESPE